QLLHLVLTRLLGSFGLSPLVRPAAGHHGTFHDVLHALDHALGRDAMLLVERDLLGAPAFGLAYCPLHRAGHLIGIQDGLAVQIPRSTTNGLDQRALGPEEALL